MTVELQIAVDCADPARLAAFWSRALGYTTEDLPTDEWQAITDPSGTGPRILFHRVPEPKLTKNRLHLDVRVGGPRGTPKPTRRPLVDAAIPRLVSLGATHLRTVDDEEDYFAVLTDPESHEFCLC
ncbi:VOC family protein [Saccharothrix syringae]|uniref:VOC family protein n=1 Tax=Saccharothrix syringae TaxID=103733 RepID=A0A5Q0GX37_SACSY|nr:VOC family protein [Saccharothrix syringae]QFZ17902.1 VOC family protein [Saccharothrix syringae]